MHRHSWALLLLCALPALAQQSASGPAYTVEVIIFRAANVGAPEDWNAPPTARGFGGDSAKAGPAPQVLRTLTAAEYKLSGMEAALRGSGAWRPLAHGAWIQTAGVWGDAHTGVNLADLGINAPGLSGTVHLERGQYLHLGFDINYGNGGPTYTLNEMRSVKLGDKQYFDHPAFGVLAVVSAAKR